MMKLLRHYGLSWSQTLLLIVLLCSSMGLFQYSMALSQYNTSLLNTQTQHLSRILLRQMAHSASPYLAKTQLPELQNLIHQLTKEPLILDATIYDLTGMTVVNTSSAMSIKQVTGIATPLAIMQHGRQQLIEPILQNHRPIGFLRVTLEHDNLIGHTQEQQTWMITIIRSLSLLSLLTGVLISAFFFSKRKPTPHWRPTLSAPKE